MLVIFDTETTGLNSQYDYIIQLSAVKLNEKLEEVEYFNEYIKPLGDFEISPAAQEKHGITKEFILKQKTLHEVAPKFIKFIEGCDLGGFNSNMFDVKFLYKDFKDAGFEIDMNRRFLDVRGIQAHLKPQSLEGIFKEYTGKTMDEAGLEAHNALSDVYATVEVLHHQLKHISLEECFELDGCKLSSPEGSLRVVENGLVFNIGKYRDKDVYEVLKMDKGWVKWWAENVATQYSRDKVKAYCQERAKQSKK